MFRGGFDDTFGCRAFCDMHGSDTEADSLRLFVRGLKDFERFVFHCLAMQLQWIDPLAHILSHCAR